MRMSVGVETVCNGASLLTQTVQLWTMNNYHYYLKQEIAPRAADKRFTSVKWHPEHAMRLYLVSESGFEMSIKLTRQNTSRRARSSGTRMRPTSPCHTTLPLSPLWTEVS
jgi:hypothetical protein